MFKISFDDFPHVFRRYGHGKVMSTIRWRASQKPWHISSKFSYSPILSVGVLSELERVEDVAGCDGQFQRPFLFRRIALESDLELVPTDLRLEPIRRYGMIVVRLTGG